MPLIHEVPTPPLRASKQQRRQLAGDCLASIDVAASSAEIAYCWSTPFTQEDVKEALQLGRCRTTRNIRLGRNGTSNRRGAVGDLTLDMQGLIAELVLMHILRHGPDVTQCAPLVDHDASKAPEFTAGGITYDIKAVGLKKACDVAQTGCNINADKTPDVYVIARIDYDALMLHVYSADGPSVRSSRALWPVRKVYSEFYERKMPDAAEFNRRTAPTWLIAMLNEQLARESSEQVASMKNAP